MARCLAPQGRSRRDDDIAKHRAAGPLRPGVPLTYAASLATAASSGSKAAGREETSM